MTNVLDGLFVHAIIICEWLLACVTFGMQAIQEHIPSSLPLLSTQMWSAGATSAIECMMSTTVQRPRSAKIACAHQVSSFRSIDTKVKFLQTR